MTLVGGEHSASCPIRFANKKGFKDLEDIKNLLLAIESRFFGCPARSLLTIVAELSERRKASETSVVTLQPELLETRKVSETSFVQPTTSLYSGRAIRNKESFRNVVCPARSLLSTVAEISETRKFPKLRFWLCHVAFVAVITVLRQIVNDVAACHGVHKLLAKCNYQTARTAEVTK